MAWTLVGVKIAPVTDPHVPVLRVAFVYDDGTGLQKVVEEPSVVSVAQIAPLAAAWLRQANAVAAALPTITQVQADVDALLTPTLVVPTDVQVEQQAVQTLAMRITRIDQQLLQPGVLIGTEAWLVALRTDLAARIAALDKGGNNPF